MLCNHVLAMLALQSAKFAAAADVQVANAFPPNGLLKQWRIPIMERIVKHCETRRTECEERDVYEFGVYTGRALRAMSRFLQLHLSSCCHAFWGFDSFQGLPADLPAKFNVSGRRTRTPMAEKLKDGGDVVPYANMIAEGASFGPGAFSVSKLLSTTNVSSMLARLDAYIDDPRVHLVPGFFNESLTAQLPRHRRMRPALYVDIDTDVRAGVGNACVCLRAQPVRLSHFPSPSRSMFRLTKPLIGYVHIGSSCPGRSLGTTTSNGVSTRAWAAAA